MTLHCILANSSIMRRFVPPAPSADQQHLLNQTLEVKRASKLANQSVVWCSVNAILCLVVLYDYLNSCPWYSTAFQYVEASIALFLAANSVYHLSQFVRYKFCTEPVALTTKQRNLLGVYGADPHIVSPIVKSPKPQESPVNCDLSWRSLNSSANLSASAPSWSYFPGTPDNTSTASPTPTLRHRISPSSTAPLLENENDLAEYLRECEEQEAAGAASTVNVSRGSPSLLGSFWAHPAASGQETPLRRTTYQTAPPDPPASRGAEGSAAEIALSPATQLHRQEMWRRLGIDPANLTQWQANLRMWISATVLRRLSTEIDAVDAALSRQGLADGRLGGLGLERLRKMATAIHGVPSLVRLLPYLELSPNQEYLVSRIKELSQGGSMSDFRWNSGGRCLGKDWDTSLPTDSALVMHMFATYLDGQLPPLPAHPHAPSFTGVYFHAVTPATVPDLAMVALSSGGTPHYTVAWRGELLRLPRSPTSLFTAILVMLHLMRVHRGGMLGRLNLGPSGLNLLCVLGDDD